MSFYGLDFFQVCKAFDGELHCTLPPLADLLSMHGDHEEHLLEYDVIMNNWRLSESALSPLNLDYQPIIVLPDPVVDGIEDGLVEFAAGLMLTIEVRTSYLT